MQYQYAVICFLGALIIALILKYRKSKKTANKSVLDTKPPDYSKNDRGLGGEHFPHVEAHNF